MTEEPDSAKATSTCAEVASACKQQGNGGQGEHLPKSKCKSSSSSQVQRRERLRLKPTLGRTESTVSKKPPDAGLVSHCALLFNQHDEGRYNYLHFYRSGNQFKG